MKWLTSDKNFYRRGLAVGQAEISTDTMVFRFRDELFEFPSSILLSDAVKFKDRFCVAPVNELRRLKQEQEKKHG